jgi:hypothetical protein
MNRRGRSATNRRGPDTFGNSEDSSGDSADSSPESKVPQPKQRKGSRNTKAVTKDYAINKLKTFVGTTWLNARRVHNISDDIDLATTSSFLDWESELANCLKEIQDDTVRCPYDLLCF